MSKFLIFFFGFSFLCSVSSLFGVQGFSQPVYFTKLRNAFNPVLAVIGKPVTIDCSVNNDNVKVSLYKKIGNGKVKVLSDNKVVRKNGNSFVFAVSSFLDSMEYLCHGEMDGNVYEKLVNVIVIGTSQEVNPRPEVFPAVAKLKSGDSLQLTCMAVGQLTVLKWYRNGQSLVTDDKTIFINSTYQKKTRASLSQLSIKSVKATDAGKYRCTVTTRLDESYVSYIDARVVVKASSLSWRSKAEQNVVTVGSKSTAIVDCSLSLSSAQVTFYLENNDGSLFKIPVSSGRYMLLTKQHLVIIAASIHDMGIYVCRVDGVEDKKTSLFVTPEPKELCELIKPVGLKRLCELKKLQFSQFMSALFRHT